MMLNELEQLLIEVFERCVDPMQRLFILIKELADFVEGDSK